MTTLCMSTNASASRAGEIGSGALVGVVRPALWVLNNPSYLFLATLVAMLFRPPDVDLYHLDRMGLILLLLVVFIRICLGRDAINVWSTISIPMAGLFALATAGTLIHPYELQAWSMLAAKFLVPFALFHVAQGIFVDQRSLRHLETFALIVLTYLCVIAIAWLAGAKWLIFPRFILDETLGIHADRARGPFLQAVANGVSLNILGLIALNAFQRRRLKGALAFFLIAALPLAILATMTRAVWFSFAASLVMIPIVTQNIRLRRCCKALVALGLAVATICFVTGNIPTALTDRAEESGPVEIRMAIYRASWEMIREKPLLGWGQNQMPTEVTRRMPDYHLDAYWAHNSYLEILVEEGVIGLTFYAWIMVTLWRIGRQEIHSFPGGCFDLEFRSLWPILLGVYLINATFVVMNYQFVNALLFSLAGVLAGQNRRALKFSSDVLAS